MCVCEEGLCGCVGGLWAVWHVNSTDELSHHISTAG